MLGEAVALIISVLRTSHLSTQVHTHGIGMITMVKRDATKTRQSKPHPLPTNLNRTPSPSTLLANHRRNAVPTQAQPMIVMYEEVSPYEM